jgi:hypothetical protein
LIGTKFNSAGFAAGAGAGAAAAVVAGVPVVAEVPSLTAGLVSAVGVVLQAVNNKVLVMMRAEVVSVRI